MNIEKFEKPVLEVEEIETKDIITVSGDGDDNEGDWGKGEDDRW